MLTRFAFRNSLVWLMQFFILATAISNREAHFGEFNEAGVPIGADDTFSIRHGRSRVREQHIWRERKTHSNANSKNPNFTSKVLSENIGKFDNETNQAKGSAHQVALSSAIPTGNGQLFGSEYWKISALNDAFTSQQTEVATMPEINHHQKDTYKAKLVPTITTVPTPTLVTHRIRKLHKKKIIERMRQRVDKSFGLLPSKNHRSLVQAEYLQGRPTDSTVSDDISNEAHNDIHMAFDDVAVSSSSSGGSSSESDVAYHLGNELNVENTQDTDYQNDDVDDDGDVSHSKNNEISAEYLATMATVVTTNAEIVVDYDTAANDDLNEIETSSFTPIQITHSLKDNKGNKHISTLPPIGHGLHDDSLSDKHLVLTSKFKSQKQTQQPNEQKLKKETNYNTKADEALNSKVLKIENTNNSSDNLTYESEYAPDDTRNWFKSNESFSAEDVDNMLAPTLSSETTAEGSDFRLNSIEPNQLASTSVGGIGVDQQSVLEFEEINFEDKSNDISLTNSQEFGLAVNDENDLMNGDVEETEEADETNRFLAGVVDAANEDEIYDWDEISRNNRRNLMRGRDVVTKFLQIVETQHMLGSNCEAGTSLNLGEGVVDRYAQERFRVEAEVAVNRANMLTRIFKLTSRAVQSDVNLLHASVLSMVEFDDDIFAAGNCFDWNEHPSQPGLFCPFAYRLPAPNLGAIFAKDLATEYHYLGNTSEWFFQARKNAEKVIARNEQYLKAFHLYSNKTEERIEDDTLAVKYEDGRWSKPYYDCGGGNIWMLTYTVPFFGYENFTYHFKGTSGIDIDLRRVDIDQCPQRNTPGMTQPLNIFAGTDKCKQRTTMCEALKGLGFRRGSYKCICRKGYYFPDTLTAQKYFNGSLLEEEYEKLMLGRNSTYNIANEYECLPCAEGCDSCEDGSPCIAALNWPMRTSILVLACTVIGLLPPAAWFTFRYQQVKVVRAASPALLRVIALGAFFIYCTNIVMYPNPNLYTCTARIWMREIGFSLTYGALMLKTWRISVIFRVRSAKAVKITDAALLKRLGCICGVIGTFLLVRTLVSPPDVVVGRTADDLKAFLCKTDWWDYTFTSMEVLFLAWGVRLCIMVRKAPSEFNESRFISMAIYNEFLLTCFLNVSMLFLQSPANPDLLYIIFFCHTQLTVTLLLGLIFGSKVYIVLRSGKSHQETIGMGAKSSGAKFNFRPQVRTFANPSSVTTSTAQVMGTNSAETKLSDQEALEEIRQLSMQLQRIQEMAPPKGVAVMTISSLLDGLKTPGGMMMVAAAATQAENQTSNQLQLRQQQQPLLVLNNEIEKYNQQLQVPQNNNIGTNLITATKTLRVEEKATNTDKSGEELNWQISSTTEMHMICTRCLQTSLELKENNSGKITKTNHTQPLTACQQLGSPLAEGSLSFANIKLECMCSQPDDLDLIQRQQRRTNVRSAATNTPPTSAHTHRKHNKSKIDDESVCYKICDKCKKKYSFRSSSKSRKCKSISCNSSSNKTKLSRLERMQQRHVSSKTAAGSSGGVISQAQSADVLESITSAARFANSNSISKKVHSIDNITFYTTTSSSSKNSTTDEDSNEFLSNGDDSDSNGKSKVRLRRRKITIEKDITVASINATAIPADVPSISNTSTNSNNSNTAEGSASSPIATANNSSSRPKRPEKLILDLNDRSKYSKEVSV